ncbi:Spc98 family-domain-containing protein [Kockovaella imperatae]|uniref:Spindle pole body component n=1 Tax=Kockovaella imperatae TaxID=4999 RepID=A0A1Y1UH09_9TREE|nr:Spc98 family-domain-containing protein [Kockovaella imperatae]ORX36375.1 Spc98 family-domain-containing protein [Kockovaella imperatae]
MVHPDLLQQASLLVQQIGPDLDVESFSQHVVREIADPSRGASRKEWSDIEGPLRGIINTLRIKVQDDVADALEKALSTLQSRRLTDSSAWEGEMAIKMGNLPDHIHFLLSLAQPPTSKTTRIARSYLDKASPSGPTADEVLYQVIMSGPFTGAHWGRGYEQEATHGWTDSESSSSESDADLVTPSTDRISRTADLETLLRGRLIQDQEDRLREAQRSLASFKEKYYWINMGQSFEPLSAHTHGWRSLATRSTTAQLEAAISKSSRIPRKVISSLALQRELLFALDGRPGILFFFDEDGACQILSGHPLVAHMSSAALSSIVDHFANQATIGSRIRRFVAGTASSSAFSSRKASQTSKTHQAFADALQEILTSYAEWIGGNEIGLLRGVKVDEDRSTPAASPMSLKLDLDRHFGTLLSRLDSLLPKPGDPPTDLLNDIYTTILSLPASAAELSEALTRVFIMSAEPMWSMLCSWLSEGMPIPSGLRYHDDTRVSLTDEKPLDKEFCIERDRDISWTDEDFWANGYVTGSGGWPLFLGERTEEMILEAGKARGLLQSFDNAPLKEDWQTLFQVLNTSGDRLLASTVPDLIFDHLSPTCRLTMFQLRRALEEDCGLDAHLDAIESLCFMQNHQVMSEWMSELFQRIGSKRQWTDFQTLSSSIREIIDQHGGTLMNPSALRIQAKKARNTTEKVFDTMRHVRAIYDVPFPLSQVLTPTSMELRSETFSVLLQLHYASHVLAESRKQDAVFISHARTTIDIRSIWQLRQQLNWVIGIFLSWLSRDVIESRTEQYRREITAITSIKGMIDLELRFARLVHRLSLLHPDVEALRAQLSSILELTTTLGKVYSQYMNDTSVASTFQPERQPFAPSKKASNTRRERHFEGDPLSDDEESDQEAELIEGDSSFLLAEDFGARLKFMKNQLGTTIAGMIDTVRSLAEGPDRAPQSAEDDAREQWAMLSMYLDEWHRFQSEPTPRVQAL